ncbi:MAG: phospho-N-acetylmuramoyl-pentapeptide-transferase, partial [Acidobacteriota bacterium]|nr:phospho-N-acetylmuramoyl-pentapeptide-transferase [Acidobacteriota bacterium]
LGAGLVSFTPLDANLSFPFFKTLVLELGVFYIPFVALLIAGSSNAVNLTDGLDGLAIGATLVAAATYAIFAYIAGNSIAARYLQVSYVPGAGEVAIICSALVGASLGFLWFNAHPAQVFMGDVGSLAIGGTIGAVAVLSKQWSENQVIVRFWILAVLFAFLGLSTLKLR